MDSITGASLALSVVNVRLSIVKFGTGDLWIVNFARGTLSRFTSSRSADFSPVWSPDGKWILYAAGPTSEMSEWYLPKLMAEVYSVTRSIATAR